MRLIKDTRFFRTYGRQFIDIEKPPVIDFLGSHSPGSQTITLLVEQGVEPVRNVLRSYLAGKQLSEPISAPLLAPTAQGTTQAAGSLGHMPAKQVGAEAGRPLLPAPQTADARDRQKRESDLVAKARSAIDRGAPREKVIERLRKFGVEPIGL